MLSFIKCFERVLIKIISDLFPDNNNTQHNNKESTTLRIIIKKTLHSA